MFKVDQIDIADYQYYLRCNAERIVPLTFQGKKVVFQSEKKFAISYYFRIIK